MSLRGAKVEAVRAQVCLHAERPDELEVGTDFIVDVRDSEGALWHYSPGGGIADVPAHAGPIEEWFAAYARDVVGLQLEDMRNDAGYDGPDPLDEHTVLWEIEDRVREAQRRLDTR